MKKLVTNVLKGLLVIILFTGTSVVLFTTGVNTVNEAQANVSEAQVIEYLEECGFQVISCNPKANSMGDWVANTIFEGRHYPVVVHVSENGIVGHEIIP